MKRCDKTSLKWQWLWNCHLSCDSGTELPWATCVCQCCSSCSWGCWSWWRVEVASTCSRSWPTGGQGQACLEGSDRPGRQLPGSKRELFRRALTWISSLPQATTRPQSCWTSWTRPQGQGRVCWTERGRDLGDRFSQPEQPELHSRRGDHRLGKVHQECPQIGDLWQQQRKRTAYEGMSATRWGQKTTCSSSLSPVSLLKNQGAIQIIYFHFNINILQKSNIHWCLVWFGVWY